MAAYTAIIGDARSIGISGTAIGPTIAETQPRLNPQLATARIRGILNPHIVSDAVGGWISADFTIPAEEAVRWRPILRYGAVVWLFDGATPIFYGHAEQPVWTSTGDCQMTLSGPWVILGRSRMREAWDLWDFSLFSRGVSANENRAGQVTVNSDNTLTLSFANGSVIAASDRVSIDYFLFGEAYGVSDQKKITAFELDVSAAVGLSASRRLRVRGMDTPTSGPADLLYDTGATGASSRQGALNLHGTNQGAAAWPQTTGYRCLNFQFVFTTGVTLSADNSVTLDRIRVSTRENLFQSVSGGVVNTFDTGSIARDVLSVQKASDFSGINFGFVASDTPPEFWPSNEVAGATDTNSYGYAYGLDPQIGTGTAPNSSVGITGFTALEWQSPADIIAALAAIDGYHVGFYLPYNGRGGYDAPGNQISGAQNDVGSFWLTAPPQLYYQPFPDPILNPDYTIQAQEGAVVTPATDSQPLINYIYTNYQTVKGRPESVIVQDATVLNYITAQGYRRVDDYTIQPTVGDNQTPTNQSQQYLAQRRLPVTTATVTIENDGSERYPILKAGCPVARLATIRPGSVNINGVATSGLQLQAGYATHVEWWGESDTGSERVELTLTQPPGQMNRQRAHGHLVNRLHRTRRGVFSQL